MKIKITTDGRRLLVRSPFLYKDLLKSIIGSRWDPKQKMWTYPFTWRSINYLANALKETGIPIAEIEISPEVELLYQGGDPYTEASSIKESTTLPNPPLSVGDDWLHQKRAYWWAENLPGVLFDMWMGTGKTRVAINLTQNWCSKGNATVLIVAPSNVVPIWAEQIARHGVSAPEWDVCLLKSGISTIKRREMAEQHYAEKGPGKISAFICNYEGVWQGKLGEWVGSRKWDVVIADEIHHIKSPGSKVSRFMAKLSSRAGRRVGLSGTPLHDGPMDIYGQARFLVPEVFGTSFSNFRARYAIMGGYGGYQVTGYRNVDEFRDNYNSFTFTAGPEEALKHLPPIIYDRRVCELSKPELKAYKELEHQFVTEVEGGLVTVSNALSKLLRLQQITSGFVSNMDGQEVQVGESKAKLLAEVMDEIPKDEPIVVFCRFKRDLATVHSVSKKLNRTSYELSGAKKELNLWRTAKGGEVLAVQLRAGGEGVPMFRAHYLIDYSLSFSLGEYQQSRARLQRPEQTSQVIAIALCAEHTVDEKIFKALEKKEDVIKTVLEGYR